MKSSYHGEGKIADVAFFVTLVVLVIFFFLGIQADVAKGCGVERWKVKTLGDKDVPSIDLKALQTTVSDLVSIPAPSRKELMVAEDSRFGAEKKTYKVRVFLVGFKLEADEDFHIVVSDGKKTMVIEVPSPDCVNDALKENASSFRASFQKRFGPVRKKFRDVSVHKIQLEVEGVGFFDFLHGQTGAADNGFELHPANSWQEVY